MVALLSLIVPAKTAQAATRFRLVRTIISPTSSGGGFFGLALAVAGDRFVVGSRDCAEVLQVCGAVHLFDSDGNLVRTIFATTSDPFSGFGDAVGAVAATLSSAATSMTRLDRTQGPLTCSTAPPVTCSRLSSIQIPPRTPSAVSTFSVVTWQVSGMMFWSERPVRI
jgi:hypothetical protein